MIAVTMHTATMVYAAKITAVDTQVAAIRVIQATDIAIMKAAVTAAVGAKES